MLPLFTVQDGPVSEAKAVEVAVLVATLFTDAVQVRVFESFRSIMSEEMKLLALNCKSSPNPWEKVVPVV